MNHLKIQTEIIANSGLQIKESQHKKSVPIYYNRSVHKNKEKALIRIKQLLRGAEEHLSVVGDPLGRQSRTARHNAQTLAKTGGRPASGLLAHHLVETVAAAGLAPFQVQVQRPQPGHQLAKVQPAKLAVVGVLQRAPRQAHRQIERPHRAQLLLRSLAACGASSGEPQQAAAGEKGGQLLLPVGGHLEAEVEAEMEQPGQVGRQPGQHLAGVEGQRGQSQRN